MDPPPSLPILRQLSKQNGRTLIAVGLRLRGDHMKNAQIHGWKSAAKAVVCLVGHQEFGVLVVAEPGFAPAIFQGEGETRVALVDGECDPCGGERARRGRPNGYRRGRQGFYTA